jgi:hypothetical protein
MHDHFIINVARRVKPNTEAFGPYHEHHMRVEIPAGTTKGEARDRFKELAAKYPEPDFQVALSQVVVRVALVRATS